MPSRSTLVRWGGLAALAAGTLYVLGALTTALDYPPAYLFTRLHLGAVWGVPMQLLTLGGLVALHARQAGSRGYGRLGTAGLLLALIGSLLAAALGPLVFSSVPDGASPSLVGMAVTAAVGVVAELGILLLGVATLRAAVLPPPWRALPLAIFLLEVPFSYLGALLFPEGIGVLILIYAQALLLGLAWALLGYALWSGMGESVGRRKPRDEGRRKTSSRLYSPNVGEKVSSPRSASRIVHTRSVSDVDNVARSR